MPTETEKAWGAGLFDGEGHIGVHLCNNPKTGYAHWKLSVMVVNTHTPTMERFQALFGGRKRYRTNGKNARNIWSWRMGEGQAAAFLEMLMPYLFTKKEQAKMALEFRETYATSNRRGPGVWLPEAVLEKRSALADSIKALNYA